MKELEPHHNVPQNDKVIAAEQRQVKTEKHVASVRIHNGHTMFEFDLTTGEINPAKIEQTDASFKGGTRKKVMQRPHCLYASALNKKNAVKHFAKLYDRLKANGKIVDPKSSEE